MMDPSRQPSYGITRVDLPEVGSKGWQVRLQRHGEKTTRFFSDRQFGDHGDSFLAAQQWRDQILLQWQQLNRARTCEVSPRNASGVVGVSRVVIKATNGNEYYFWQATWCPSPGMRKSIKFSVKKHGDQIAYQLAIEARQSATDA